MPSLKNIMCGWLLTALGAISLVLTAQATPPNRVIDVTKAGVSGDGTTLNTVSIQKVIDDCASTGGGVVSFPAGRYLTGTIQIKSNVTLRLENDATLLGSSGAADYRNLDPFIDSGGSPMGHALIVAVDATNVGLEGGGTVDGQSVHLQPTQGPVVRPFLVRWVRCTNVSLRDVHLTHPGSWTLHLFGDKGVVIEGITLRSREPRMRNTDGIDIDSCEDVVIRNCDIVSRAATSRRPTASSRPGPMPSSLARKRSGASRTSKSPTARSPIRRWRVSLFMRSMARTCAMWPSATLRWTALSCPSASASARG